MKPPPENSLLIFAGSADIPERNMRRQLVNWLPSTLKIDPPVIQEEIPHEYGGLLKVRAWLEDEFPDHFEEIADLPQYIDTLESTADAYLVVLWGAGGDEDTEKLVDMAARRGIKVLDLTDGLDTLELGHRAPTAAETEPETRTRRRRAAAAVREDAEVPQDTPVAAPQDARPDPDRVLIGLLGMAFQAAADVFLGYLAASPVTRPAAEPADVRDTEEIPQETAEETRAWYQNPGNPDEYEVKKNRGRVPNAVKGWTIVHLTRKQEAGLGLRVPGER